MDISVNTILHTKDGRKIGNAIVVKVDGMFCDIKTDYGNLVKGLCITDIEDLFFIAYSDYEMCTHGLTFEKAQKMHSDTHKHRVTI